jgi:hypothetical protein
MKRILLSLGGIIILLIVASLGPAGWQLFAAFLILVAYAVAPYLHFQSKTLRWFLILISGLIVEYFAWLNNYLSQVKNPPLFHPILGPDLFIGLFFYGSMALAWNIIEKQWGMRIKDVIIMTLIFSICIEQLGKILLTFNPLFYAYVGIVYLAMVLPGFLLVKPQDKPVSLWKRYVYGLIILFLASIIGTNLLVLPFKSLIPSKPATAQIK